MGSGCTPSPVCPAQGARGATAAACVYHHPPCSRAGNNKRTAEETGNDLGKIEAVFSAGALKRLQQGLPSPLACKGEPGSSAAAQDPEQS